MRRFFPVLMLAGLLALAACAAQETTKEEAKPAAPAAAPAAPAAPAPEAKPAWEQEWERVLAAAKKEGAVAVAGPAGTAHRQVLTEPFEKKFGIPVKFFGGRGSEQLGRITAEREAGQYLWDLYIGGSSTPLVRFKPMGALEPLAPTFILPEVKEPKNWREGKYPFLDKEGRYTFGMIGQVSDSLTVNPKVVKPGETIKSWKDLLDPKWKGKITSGDPRTTGSAQGQFQFMYLHPELGPDFIRALLKQDLFITRDYTTQARWVAEGRYPICVGCSDAEVAPLIEKGVPLAYVTPKQMKEGGYIGTSNGSLSMFTRAPHPNATKVYVNWLLSKEGATEFVKAADKYISQRVDVPPNPGFEWSVPTPTDIPTHLEEARLQRDKLRAFFREVLKEAGY